MSQWIPHDDASVDGSDQALGPGTKSTNVGLLRATNKNNEDCWILFYRGATIAAGTLVYRLFVPKGDGTARGVASDNFGEDGLVFIGGCRYKAVKTSDGTTAPGTALELSATYR